MVDKAVMIKGLMFCGLFGLCSSLYGQIINIEDKRKSYSDSIAWHETVDLGFNLYQNTERVTALSATAQVEFAFHNKLLISITSGTFVKAGDNDFVNEGYQHLRYNSDLNDWLTLEVFGQAQYNEQARIKLRALGGTGLRFRILQNKEDRAHLGFSYMYEYDEESTSGIIHEDSRLNTYLSFKVALSKTLTVASTTYFQPLFEDFQDYRLSSTSSAIFDINDKLAFRARFNISYDTRASAGAPRTVYNLRNSLSYTF